MTLERVRRIGITIVLAIGAVAMVLPYYWMFITSIKPLSEIHTYPPHFYVLHPTIKP